MEWRARLELKGRGWKEIPLALGLSQDWLIYLNYGVYLMDS